VEILSSRIRELPLVFLDLETTGLEPEEGHEILEFGAVRTLAGEEKAQIDMLIRPNRPIPPESSKVHGITDLFVMGAPSFEMAAAEILEFVGESVVIAHNAPFDVSFLARSLEAIGRTLPSNPVMDSVTLARSLLPGLASHRLEALKKTFEVTSERAHRALDDSRALARVFARMIDQYFHAIDGGPTLAQVASRAAPLFRFSDFGGGLPQRSGEARALLRWALRDQGDLQVTYAPPGRTVPEEMRVRPVELLEGPPAVLKALVRPRDVEVGLQVDRIRACRRAG
jgi:DNA polymerase III epsilon subunit